MMMNNKYPKTDFGPCSNCGITDWGARNESYCSSCATEYLEAYRQTICSCPNPLQKLADEVMAEYG